RAEPASAPAPAQPLAAAKRKRSFKEQKEFDALPEQIAAAEAEAVQLDAKFADAAFYSGPRAAVEQAQTRRAELKAQIDRLYSRWAELE
ncbi:MAG: ABC transporter ATP-binding protein, partial [Planctomycetes bacterium]|nr:ABC transporter ATP-binding protein [Planctomycetota bacterium]